MNRAEAIPGQLSFEGTSIDAPAPSSSPPATVPAPRGPGPGGAPSAGSPPVAAVAVAAGTSPDAGPWAPAPAPADRGGLVVEVVRSARRRKTAQARLHGSRLEIRIPAGCSRSEEAELVKHFRSKFERMRGAEDVDLAGRAAELATAYGLPLPSSIRWVGNQNHRWGSCTPADGTIRLSDRMAGFPTWVVDYVIVHELAHLVVASHSARFWDLVNAYPLTERARGFLMAKGWEED